jgi:hypothetical protein
MAMREPKTAAVQLPSAHLLGHCLAATHRQAYSGVLDKQGLPTRVCLPKTERSIRNQLGA